MLKNILTLLFLLFGVTTAFSQSVDVSYNPDYYHQIDRLEIKSGKLSASQSSVKPLSRKDIVAITDTTLHRETLNLSAKNIPRLLFQITKTRDKTKTATETLGALDNLLTQVIGTGVSE